MKKVILWTACAVVVAASALAAWRWSQLGGQQASWWRLVRTETGGEPHYEPIQYRAKDARPAITNATFTAATNAQLAGGTMGIGVAVGGEAKFYPLHILAYHQVVNDTCGGTKIACTY
jgi:hypothetical protein